MPSGVVVTVVSLARLVIAASLDDVASPEATCRVVVVVSVVVVCVTPVAALLAVVVPAVQQVYMIVGWAMTMRPR